MKENYAEVLEGYLIPAMEAIARPLKLTNEVKSFFNKIGLKWNLQEFSYTDLTDFVEDVNWYSGLEGLDKITPTDLKKFHSCFYNEKEAIDYFVADDPNTVATIRKIKPIPIYAVGNGDHYCLTESLEVKEYIHDVNPSFDSKYASNYKSFKEFIQKFYKPYAES